MRIQGTVREWKFTYGFITWHMTTDRGARLRHTFVHWTAVVGGHRRLNAGDVVEFEVETDDTGRQHAANVTVIKAARAAA